MHAGAVGGRLGHRRARPHGRKVGQGLHVDVADDRLARRLGAQVVANAATKDAVAKVIKETDGGAHDARVTAVSPPAFAQAIAITRRRGTVGPVGLPPADFPTTIFEVVLKRIALRGSIVGTRQDLAEAIAVAGKVRAAVTTAPLERVNDVVVDLKAGRVDGRVVLQL